MISAPPVCGAPGIYFQLPLPCYSTGLGEMRRHSKLSPKYDMNRCMILIELVHSGYAIIHLNFSFFILQALIDIWAITSCCVLLLILLIILIIISIIFFITNMTNAHKLQSQVHVVRNTAYWPSTQGSYKIGSGMTIQEN